MKDFFVKVAACFIATTGMCAAANTGPLIDLGAVSTFKTAQIPKSPSLVVWEYPLDFKQQVTFTLSSAATVRIDMREIGLEHWLAWIGSDLYINSFSLLNSNQQLVATASADPAFTGDTRYCYTGSKCGGSFARGFTLTTSLEAGTYAMDLQGTWRSGNMPELDFGVLVAGVGDQAAYFAALTSPTNLPEPSTWFMMAMGLGAVAFCSRKRRAA